MAQHEKDPVARSHDASEAVAGDVWTTTAVDPSAGAERTDAEPISTPEAEAISAPEAKTSAPPPRRRRGGQFFTRLAAALGLLATAGAIGAYHFRDRHETLATFAALVDETFARPETLVDHLRARVVEWTGGAPAPIRRAAPAAPPRTANPPPTVARESVEPSRPAPSAATPPAPSAPAPAAPAPAAPPVAAQAPDDARAEALARRVDELEDIARSALLLAEQARAAAVASAEAPAASSPPAPPPANAREIEDNLSGLEGRIDWLAGELEALRARLDAPKDETRVAREAAPPPPEPEKRAAEKPEPAKEAGPNSAAIVVIAFSLQKELERGAPFATEYAALAAQGADAEALAALAPSAETGAPDARALRAALQPLLKKLETANEAKPAPLADRLLRGLGRLVKIRGAADKEKPTIAEIGARTLAALDRADIAAALDAFAALPEEAKAPLHDWEESARRRLDAETAAAAILSNAIAALGKSKS